MNETWITAWFSYFPNVCQSFELKQAMKQNFELINLKSQFMIPLKWEAITEFNHDPNKDATHM